MPTIEKPLADSGYDVIYLAKRDRVSFLTEADLRVIATDPNTHGTLILVRCGGGRFLAPADQVEFLVEAIRQAYKVHGGGYYVRGYSLPAGS
jgi:hypothetical protein